VKTGVALPVIFITGHADVPMTVRAMKAGAVEFLTKPFRDVELLDAIHTAIERDRGRREEAASLDMLRLRYGQLTAREREVMALVAGGLANKQVAAGSASARSRQGASRPGDAQDARSLAARPGAHGRPLGLPIEAVTGAIPKS
jgi:FixJ family two-component response regulator